MEIKTLNLVLYILITVIVTSITEVLICNSINFIGLPKRSVIPQQKQQQTTLFVDV